MNYYKYCKRQYQLGCFYQKSLQLFLIIYYQLFLFCNTKVINPELIIVA